MKLVNLTPHPIDIYRLDCDEVLVTLKPSGQLARLREEDGERGASVWLCDYSDWWDDKDVEIVTFEETENYVLAVPVVERDWGEVKGLPEPRDGVGYVVPMLVMQGSDRRDLYATDFGSGAVRNERGTVIGTRRLLTKRVPDPGQEGVRWSGLRSEQDEAHGREQGWWEPRKA